MKVGRRFLFALLVVLITLATPVAFPAQQVAADGGTTYGLCHTGTFCGG